MYTNIFIITNIVILLDEFIIKALFDIETPV